LWPPNRGLETWLRDEFEDWLCCNGIPSPLDEVRGNLTLGIDEDHMEYVLFEPKPPWKRWLVDDLRTLMQIAVGVLTFTTLLFLFYVAFAHPIVGWLG